MKFNYSKIIINQYNLKFILVIIISFLFLNKLHSTIIPENFWNRSYSPVTNEVNLIKIDSKDNLYFSVWGDGVYFSNDDGASWLKVNTGLTNLNVTCIDFDSLGNVYAGTYGGVFKSTNKGVNWTNISNGLTNLKVKSLIFNKSGDLIIGTLGGGISILQKDSLSFKRCNSGIYYYDINCLIKTNLNYILAGTNGQGIYKSTDNGWTWKKNNAGISARTINNFFIDIDDEIYACTNGNGVMISVNNGDSWNNTDTVNMPLNIASCVAMYHNLDFELVVCSQDKGLWYQDFTKDFAWIRGIDSAKGAISIAINSKNKLFASLPSDGYSIRSSTNYGRKWDTVNFSQLSDVNSIVTSGSKVICALDSFKMGAFSSDNGKTWSYFSILDSAIKCFAFDSSGNIYAGTTGGIYKSTNNGTAWTLFAHDSSLITSIATDKNWIYATVYKHFSKDLYGKFFYSTSDAGSSWTYTFVYDPETNPSKPHISLVENIWVNQFTHYVFSYNSFGGLWWSSDNGTTWTKRLATSNFIHDIAFCSDSIYYAASDSGLYKTINNGLTWSKFTLNLKYPVLHSVTVAPGGYIYVGTMVTQGILRSTNNGASWDTINSGIELANINSIRANTNGYVFVGTTNLFSTIDEKSMIMPYLVAPATDSAGLPYSPTLSWHKTNRAEMYDIQVSSNEDFTSINEEAFLADTIYKVQQRLAASYLYFWRVRSKTNSSYGAWSEVRRFTTTFESPTLVSPLNLSGGCDLADTLFWNSVAEAGAYWVQLATDSSFATKYTIKEDKNHIDTSIAISNLKNYTRYYWRVKAKRQNIYSDWSETWSFWTKLPAVTLTSPDSASYGQATKLKLTWKPPTGTAKAGIQISKSSDFTQISSFIFEGITDAIDNHTINLLQNNTTYYWRVRAIDDNENYGTWSVIWCFTTMLDSVVLLKPDNGTVNQPVKVDFQWSKLSSAKLYRLQVSRDTKFLDNLYDKDTITTENCTIYLDHYVNYYWRVAGISGNGYQGEWSSSWTLRSRVDSVQLYKPYNDTINQETTIYLIWRSVTGGLNYHVQLSKTEDFSNGSLVLEQDSLANLQTTAYNLDVNTKYYWRVEVFNKDGRGDWSEIWHFTTKDTKDVKFYNGNVFYSNEYPNPFSEILNIKFGIEKSSYVSINITDIYGKVIENIFEKFVSSGNYNISWHPTNLADGIYFYTIDTEYGQISKKIVYIKK